jgi:hypothetical protein
MAAKNTKRAVVAGAVAAVAIGGFAAFAAPSAAAADWNIPWHDLHYPFFPQCNKHIGPSGYGTETCKAYYTVNRGNYTFTEDNINSCPAMGAVEHITIDYVLNPVGGGVTWNRVLVGFAMHW